jgi:outer membrane usher protein
MRSGRRACAALLLAFALAGAAGAAAPREVWYQAVVDNADSGLTVLVLRYEDGSMAVRHLDLALLGVAAPEEPGQRHEGEMFSPVSALPHHTISFDDAQGRAYLQTRRLADIPASASVATDSSIAVVAPAATPATSTPASTPLVANSGEEQWLVDVVVNSQPVAGTWLLRREQGAWWLDAGLLAAAGLRPRDEAVEVSLTDLAGNNYVLDTAALRLELSVPTDRFVGSGFSLADAAPTVIERQPSAVVGYDIASGVGEGRQWYSALVDAGVARGDVSCRSVQAWRSRVSGVARLETACVYDWPDRMLSLRVGDNNTRSGAFGQSVRYGGVRIGTDYGLAPYLQTLPALTVAGSARLPSILEIYVDQRLALWTEVPPGPFDIRDIPVTTGNGEVRTVVTDALGRQSVVTSPFYSDPMLLRAGLLDWSAEIGRVRTGFLGTDERYADGFATLSARRGISDALTLELRAESRDDAAMLGVSATTRIGAAGVAEAGVSESRDGGIGGRAFLLGYAYRGRDWNMGLRRWWSDEGYRALGFETAGSAPAEFGQAHFTVRLARAALSLSAVLRDRRDGERQRLVTAGLSVPVGGGGLVNMTLSHALEAEGDTQFGLIWSMPLGAARSAYLAAQQSGGGTALQTGLQRSPPPGAGMGYRLQASHGDGNDALFAQGVYRSDVGVLELAGAGFNDDREVRAQWSGGVIANRAGVFLARMEPGAYAAVDVGAPDVRVYRDNQPVAASGKNGIALVPGLRPFERNRLRVSTQDLPMQRQVDSDEITVVPGRGQAIAAAFAVREVHWISGQLRREDLGLVPAGAELLRTSDGSSLGQVGYDGLVFIELPSRNAIQVQARWGSHTCVFELEAANFDAHPHQAQALTCRQE